MKRAGAIIAVFLLISMYMTTLICAVIGSDFAVSMLQASIFGTIFLPVILYVYLYLFKLFNRPSEEHKDAAKQQEEN